MNNNQLLSSFRDPSGFLFKRNGKILRQINQIYKQDYDLLMSSALYESLTSKKWLIPHQEIETKNQGDYYKIIEPDQLSYISYPHEWSFSQLKDAALLTLDIQLEALKYGMSLKDATAYNIQFHNGGPIFIDTLSFETYEVGKAWVAYRQYCQYFLGPLALISYKDYRLIHLLKSYINGIPLDLTSRLLPLSSWFKYSILAHIHLHAKTQKKYEDVGRTKINTTNTKISLMQLEGLLLSLRNATNSLTWKYGTTEWGDYYEDTNYVDESMEEKEKLVTKFLADNKSEKNQITADFGANTGKFSRLAAALGYFVLAHDIDEVAVDKNYLEAKNKSEENILPLVQDLTNPSPAIGWANRERMSFGERHDVDVGLALAIIHHISISNNVPLIFAAEFFSDICKLLIIEFVPKSDSQVKRLLASRADIFPDYNETGFEEAFSQYFVILSAEKIKGTERTLYLMKRKQRKATGQG